MTDQIDLSRAQFEHSPNVAAWAPTVRITRVSQTAAGGFVIEFDRVLPEGWKWPSNPEKPSDNFQFTVWMGLQLADGWHLAGFVQMWQGRPMGTRELPPVFADVDGVPGFKNWWGDPRGLWGPMSTVLPADGQQVALFVTAGNGRLWPPPGLPDVSSKAERSNVVLFTLHANDAGDQTYQADSPALGPLGGSTESHVSPLVSPTDSPIASRLDQLERMLGDLTTTVNAIRAEMKKAPAAAPIVFPDYNGSGTIPAIGHVSFTLTPVKT
jgi:hypothetical protein